LGYFTLKWKVLTNFKLIFYLTNKNMKRPYIQVFCTIISLAVFITACDTSKKDSAKQQATTPATEVPEAQQQAQTENTWIDASEADNLTNTWVDEEDKGQLSNTWAEDAFSEELSGSSTSNSWVDADGETIYKKTEVPPEFVGGKEALYRYFQENIQYPPDVARGSVYVAFVVNKEGEIRDVRIVKGVNEGCDKEALRLIKNMPKWDPGMEKGNIVSSVYGLPVIFRP
jgi:TonB family protein